MKIPICDLCAKTAILCPGCEDKLKNGKISELDVRISRTLYKLKDKYNLGDACFIKAIDLGRVVLLLTTSDVGMLIGKEGKVVAEISQAVGKKVRIAEMGKDIRKTIMDIVTPAKILGINTIYKGGEKTYKVRFSRDEIKQIPIDINTLEKALNSLFESRVSISFE